MKMEHEQNLQNPEFMPPPPVSNMSDMAPNDTFKQDLRQTAIELGQTDQIQDNQLLIHQQQLNPDQLMMQQQQIDQEQMMMHHQQQHNQEEMMIHQQQNQDQMMMHQQQCQDQLMMQHQQQQNQDQMMMQHQTQSMEEQLNMNPSIEIPSSITQDIHDDLAISDSDDEDGSKGHQRPPLAMKTQENEDDDGGLWF